MKPNAKARQNLESEKDSKSLMDTLAEIFASAPDGYEPSPRFRTTVAELLQTLPIGAGITVYFDPEKIELFETPKFSLD